MIKKCTLALLLVSIYPIIALPSAALPTVKKQVQLQSAALPFGTGCYAALKLLQYSRTAAFGAITIGGIWGLYNNRKFS